VSEVFRRICNCHFVCARRGSFDLKKKNQFNQLIIDNLKVLNTSVQLFALGSINILQCEIQTFQE
jgi:hypothetical protein